MKINRADRVIVNVIWISDLTDVWNRYTLIHERLANSVRVADNVCSIIAALEADSPHADWEELRALPYDAEVEFLRDSWFIPVLTSEPPSAASITGMYFGLFHPIRDGEAVTDMYVSGSPSYREDGEDASWASDPEYFPNGRYAHSRILTSLHRVTYGHDGLCDGLEFVCLSYAAFAAKSLLSKVAPALIPSSNQAVGVAVGWDSGDALYIGAATRAGFVSRDPDDAAASLLRRKQMFIDRFGGNE